MVENFVFDFPKKPKKIKGFYVGGKDWPKLLKIKLFIHFLGVSLFTLP